MSSVKATIYDRRTGEIRMGVEAPDKETVLLQEIPEDTKIHWGEVYSHENHYFAKDLAVPRPPMNLRIVPGLNIIKGETVIITNIPVGCVVTYPGGTTTINDGKAEWGSIVPGTYTLKFTLFPYIDEVLDVIVRDA